MIKNSCYSLVTPKDVSNVSTQGPRRGIVMKFLLQTLAIYLLSKAA